MTTCEDATKLKTHGAVLSVSTNNSIMFAYCRETLY
jgi:hypothetical protein